MISEREIMKIVKEYAKSPEGKAEIKKVYGVDYDENFTKTTINKWTSKMRKILFEHVHSLIDSFNINDIIIGEPEIRSDGKAAVSISFNEAALARKSLDPESYPEGISNIVLLFAHGYHTSNPLFGVWERPSGSIEIWAKRNREPNDFLYDAVNEFNSSAQGIAFAKLENEYK